MRISVFAAECNPAVDTPFIRRSVRYCETEVREGRATQLDPGDIRAGIQLLRTIRSTHKLETRGSREENGCLSAFESELSADYRPHGDDFDQAFAEGRALPLPKCEIPLLAVKYEHHFDKHIAQRRKGTPRMCAIIAARVKTILSNPATAEAGA